MAFLVESNGEEPGLALMCRPIRGRGKWCRSA